MKAAQANFQNAYDACNTAWNDMTEQQTDLQANWTGEAASSFGQALSTYLGDLGTVRAQLLVMLDSLSGTTGVYVNTAGQSTDVATAFATGLPGLTGI